MGPTSAAACFQVQTSLSPDQIFASLAVSESAGTPCFAATRSKIFHKACSDARRFGPDTPPIVMLPPDPLDEGYRFDPMFTLTDDSGMPKVSASTMPIAVRVPVPRSWLPAVLSTVPSGFTRTRHVPTPAPPPQVCSAMPTPCLTALPGPLPAGCHLPFQSMSLAAICISSA